MLHRLHFRIFADYFQFYVWDPEASGQDAPEEWSDEDVRSRAKASEHVFVVCPARSVEVPFTLEVHESEPSIRAAEWDHIVEASVGFPSGRLEVHECTGGSHAEISIDPGIYVVRALYKGLGTVSEDGFEGNDSYVVTLWKGEARDFRVLKSYSEVSAI